MNTIQTILIAVLPSATVGFAVWLLQRSLTRREDRREKREEERESARAQKELLLIKSTRAAVALGEAAALALKNGKTNGETENALQYARTVKHELSDFLAEQGVKNMQQ
jgi:hypothetical protein